VHQTEAPAAAAPALGTAGTKIKFKLKGKAVGNGPAAAAAPPALHPAAVPRAVLQNDDPPYESHSLKERVSSGWSVGVGCTVFVEEDWRLI
jgi:hypothetical protein